MQQVGARLHTPSLAQIADQVFDDLERDVSATGQLSDDHLARLSLLLGRNFAKALAVVDGGGVQCFQGAPSGRRAFQVAGGGGGGARRGSGAGAAAGGAAAYVTLPRHHCTCQAFHFEVVCKSEAAYCKHQLAARLALLLRRCPVLAVPDTTLAEILLQG